MAKTNQSHSTKIIKHNRNIVFLMFFVPMSVFGLVYASLHLGNTRNESIQAQSNLAKTLGPGKVGYDANIPGLHSPANLNNHSGNFTTSSNNQIVQNLNITGKITVKHSNVRIVNVKAKQIKVDAKKTANASADISWSTIGIETGGKISDYGHAAIGNGNLKVYRSEIFGFVDLVQLSCGRNIITENWFHDLFDDSLDPGQGGGSSHPDPIQFIPTGFCDSDSRKLDGNIISNNRFDSWTFTNGEKAGDNWGKLNSDVATSGLTLVTTSNQSQPAPANTTITENYIDGNYSHAFYANTKSNAGPSDNAQNLVITDNIFKKRYPNYGKQKYASVTSPPNGGSIQLTHGRNIDADNGREIHVNCGSSCTKPPTGSQPPPTPTPSLPPTPNPDSDPDLPVTGTCVTTGSTLAEARNKFASECPEYIDTRDCDPIGNGWTCSSEQIGGGSPIGDDPGTDPTPSPEPPRPPIQVPDANPTDPVPIPDGVVIEDDGTIIADFTGDGLNDIVKDTNGDGRIDPQTEIIVDGNNNLNLTDTNQDPIKSEEFFPILEEQRQATGSFTGIPTDDDAITIKAGPLPEAKVSKPVAYTFLIAQGFALTGIGAYFAITKLAIFSGLRGRLGL